MSTRTAVKTYYVALSRRALQVFTVNLATPAPGNSTSLQVSCDKGATWKTCVWNGDKSAAKIRFAGPLLESPPGDALLFPVGVSPVDVRLNNLNGGGSEDIIVERYAVVTVSDREDEN